MFVLISTLASSTGKTAIMPLVRGERLKNTTSTTDDDTMPKPIDKGQDFEATNELPQTKRNVHIALNSI